MVALRGLDTLVRPFVDHLHQSSRRHRNGGKSLRVVLANARRLRGPRQTGRADMPEAVLEVEPSIVWQADRMAGAIRHVERCLPLPEDQFLVDLQHQWIGPWALEQPVPPAGDWVRGGWVRERSDRV